MTTSPPRNLVIHSLTGGGGTTRSARRSNGGGRCATGRGSGAIFEYVVAHDVTLKPARSDRNPCTSSLLLFVAVTAVAVVAAVVAVAGDSSYCA